MVKQFSIKRDNALMNFTLKYCVTEQELLDSKAFRKVVKRYIDVMKDRDDLMYDRLTIILGKDDDILDTIIRLFKLLISFDLDEVEEMGDRYKILLREKELLYRFIEGLYAYWRRLDRYALIHTIEKGTGLQRHNFIEATNGFTNLVLKVYRRIEQTILEKEHNVFRELSAGVNGGVVFRNSSWKATGVYEKLNRIHVIESIVLRPPFITYPKKNKRSKVYSEVTFNPLANLEINADEFLCYPAMVGEYLTYVYFHQDFMAHGITLANLFKMAPVDEVHQKPDMVYVFGAPNGNDEMETYYHYDEVEDLMVGFANNHEDLDYFGYMKKMLLTLHNVKQIKHNALPIHGAMVNIVLKDGKEANVCIIGDSGAGKSESLEAFRLLSLEYLKDMKIVFDDMGVFKMHENKVQGYGTEIGAFVRLDDLDAGYAYKEIDRAIFMNPDKTNARLVIPVSTYEEIMEGYKIDLLLYANNYESNGGAMHIFDTVEEAKEAFVKGARRAKGTTTEEGIVESFFANPFGPVQNQDHTLKLIDTYFNRLFDDEVPVGIIYTQLAIEGKEQSGPKEAAVKIFEWIKENA